MRDPVSEKKANEEIAKDCASIGVKIDSPWDLVGSQGDKLWSQEIAVIFAKHLTRAYPDNVLEGIILAGSWVETRELFFEPVVKILRKHGNSGLGQIAANGLLSMANESDEHLLRELILDRSIGLSRSLLVAGFAKLAKQRAIAPLRLVSNDRDLRSEALKALSKLGDQTIRPQLQKLAKHEDSYHRKIAKDAIVRLDKKMIKNKEREDLR